MTGGLEETEACLVNARALAFGTSNEALVAEVCFYSAVHATRERRSADVRRFLNVLLELADVDAGPARLEIENRYPYSVSFWRSRAFELQSKDGVYGFDAAERSAALLRAFEEFGRRATCDRYIEASMLLNAAVIVRDTGDHALKSVVLTRLETFEWSDSLAMFESFIFHAIGRRHAFEGDHVSALRSFRRSTEAAPTTPLKILAMLDRCRLVRELGEATSAAEELDHATKLASTVQWRSCSIYERDALLTLAELMAATDVMRARELFDRFKAISGSKWNIELSGEASLRRADYRMVESVILLAEGKRPQAIDALVEAYEIWRSSQNDRRMILTACDLAELTGERQYIDIAVRGVLRYPNTIFARRIRALIAATDSRDRARA
ncbi:MAG: hypothetical protein NVS2B3_07380 [Vulcanimicrobiaceae bacterium]